MALCISPTFVNVKKLVAVSERSCSCGRRRYLVRTEAPPPVLILQTPHKRRRSQPAPSAAAVTPPTWLLLLPVTATIDSVHVYLDDGLTD